MNGLTIIASLGNLQWPKVLIGGVIACMAYYFLLFNDGAALQKELDSASAEFVAAKHGLDQTKKAIADADKFEKDVKVLALQFKNIQDYMPENLGPSMLTEIISQQAASAGAVVAKMEPTLTGSAPDPKDVKDKADFYDVSRMAITLEGSYAQLAKFFSNLSKLPKILTFDNMTITEMTGGDLEHPKLAMSTTVIGYRYKKESSPDAAGKDATANPAASPAPDAGASGGK